jgi:predicted nucleic acid-binding protein
MTGPVFVDTNVLIYCFDARYPAKRKDCLAWLNYLWRSGQGRLPWQMLNEFYVNVTRRLDPGLTPEQARIEIEDLSAWNPLAIDVPWFSARSRSKHATSYLSGTLSSSPQLLEPAPESFCPRISSKGRSWAASGSRAHSKPGRPLSERSDRHRAPGGETGPSPPRVAHLRGSTP